MESTEHSDTGRQRNTEKDLLFKHFLKQVTHSKYQRKRKPNFKGQLLDLLLSEGLDYQRIPRIPDEYFPEQQEIIETEGGRNTEQIVPYPRLG